MKNLCFNILSLKKNFIVFIFFLTASVNLYADKITLLVKDATVWSQSQTIKGIVNSSYFSSGTLYLNNNPILFSIDNSSFSIPVFIEEGTNSIFIEIDSAGTQFYSDTLHLTLGYKLRPEVFAYAEAEGNNVSLHGKVISNPDSGALNFNWIADQQNPFNVILSGESDSVAAFTFSSNAPDGEYYFDCIVSEDDGDTVKARTYVTVDSGKVIPFNIKTDYAAWIDSTVIYEITPYNFVNGQSDFKDIINKIPELAALGITALWLQPIYPTYGGGQGYDVTNYFGIRSDYGTAEDLHNLIQTAKSFGLKVLFDFVANHSSIHHPYAVNSTEYGDTSHYYNFYQREEDDAPYSQYYRHYNGFINYFWDELPNLNYDNPEVQKWITEAAKYWIENFDIDGYRFDAIWGVNARKPEFTKQLRLALKRIKPEILMLAEGKATVPLVFDERFDAAYDWFPEESWVSHWAWQTDYNPNANPTIFNYPNENMRANLLRNSLTNNGNGYAPNAKILRFLENNDTYHFITHHGLERTKMAAALEFSLNGIPLIYNGQEAGISGHPYETEYLYYPGFSIQSFDQYGLFPYYQRLIEIRKNLPALYSDNFSEIPVTPNNFVYSYRRWKNNQNVFCVINMGVSPVNSVLEIPVSSMNLDSSKTYYLTDLINGEVFSADVSDLENINIPLERFTTRILLFADTATIVTGIEDKIAKNIPGEFKLLQNYPNPFNPSTTIHYSIPAEGKVSLKVFDILGREVSNLVNEYQRKGEHKIIFNASSAAGGLASGIYFYRLEFNNKASTHKMILLK